MSAETSGAERQLFSILMPVYNEYAFVRECVERVLAAPLPGGVDRELVIVDDGSKDGTRDILAKLEEKHPEIRLVLHETNQGKGAAIRTAIREMKGDIAIFQDADLEYDPADYRRVIQPIVDGFADVVYGSRFAASELRRVLFYRHALGNRLLTFLSNLFTDLYLTDMETCYKAFRTSILKSIPIRSNDFGLEPEITAKVAKRDCVVYEVPVSYRGRTYDEGKKIGWKDGFRALYTIFKYWVIDDCYDERYGHNVLLAMNSAPQYSRWMADISQPYFGRKVAELGSGIGNMSRQLAAAPRLVVTDRDPEYLDFLENLFHGREDVKVRKLDLDRPEDFGALAEEEVDTVVAFNVLEHIEDDKQVIERLHEALPYGGRVILQVPQYPGLFGSFDEEVDHKRRYDKIGLSALLAGAGFEVEKLKNVNWFGTFGWYVNGKLLKRRHFSRVQLKLFDMLVPVLRLFNWLPLPGLSLFAVARKR